MSPKVSLIAKGAPMFPSSKKNSHTETSPKLFTAVASRNPVVEKGQVNE